MHEYRSDIYAISFRGHPFFLIFSHDFRSDLAEMLTYW